MRSIAESAQKYYGMGLSLIPIRAGTKKPACRWKQFQSERATDADQQKWFGDTDSGVAVVLGRVSGDLICRDFDQPESYPAWREAHPDLADLLPTVKTQRGHHVYCRIDPAEIQAANRNGSGTIKLDDGELRGEGAYTILPPTVHEDGECAYAWTVPISEQLPRLTLSQTGFLAVADTSNVSLCRLGCVGDELATAIEDAVLRTIPDRPAQRNAKLFELARRLKGIIPGATADELRVIVMNWHARALPFIRTKAFDESWTDFVVAWGRVKVPGGSEFRLIVERARTMPNPPEALRYEDNRLRLLVRLCKALDDHHNKQPFPLSCRIAANVLGIGSTRAAELLKVMLFDGILELVSKGNKLQRRAYEYRYTGQKP